MNNINDLKNFSKSKRKKIAKECCNFFYNKCNGEKPCCIIEADLENKCKMIEVVVESYKKWNEEE